MRITNPAPWRFKRASTTSQSAVQGAEFAPFAAGFDGFPLRVGVLDLVQSTACGSARRIGGDSGGGPDAGSAHQSPRPQRRAKARRPAERIQHRGLSNRRESLPKMEYMHSVRFTVLPSSSTPTSVHVCMLLCGAGGFDDDGFGHRLVVRTETNLSSSHHSIITRLKLGRGRRRSRRASWQFAAACKRRRNRSSRDSKIVGFASAAACSGASTTVRPAAATHLTSAVAR